jgi:restriction system protein
MSIPHFQSVMLPVLQLSATGEAKIGAAVERLADKFALTNDKRSALLPTGRYV